jgi:hypothetical protein
MPYSRRSRPSAVCLASGGYLGKDFMRLFVLALTLVLADFAGASAQTATPDNENGVRMGPYGER